MLAMVRSRAAGIGGEAGYRREGVQGGSPNSPPNSRSSIARPSAAARDVWRIFFGEDVTPTDGRIPIV
jgi:hypothetical protein